MSPGRADFIGDHARDAAAHRFSADNQSGGLPDPCHDIAPGLQQHGFAIRRPPFVADPALGHVRKFEPHDAQAFSRNTFSDRFHEGMVHGSTGAVHSPLADEYHRMVETIGSSLRFMEHILGIRAGATDKIDFFTAHEALRLGYEEADTRTVPRRTGWFNLSAHFPWAGLRQPPGRRALAMQKDGFWTEQYGRPVYIPPDSVLKVMILEQ